VTFALQQQLLLLLLYLLYLLLLLLLAELACWPHCAWLQYKLPAEWGDWTHL
jgi:hypothetical protein